MPHYHLWTIGCQMNQAESRRIDGLLVTAGYESVPHLDAADLVVLNTCQHPLDPHPAYRPTEVKLEVCPGSPPSPDDPSLTIRPENLRAHENNETFIALSRP